MAGYINESNPWDFGGALQRGFEGGRVRRAKTEAKGYLDSGDYEGAAKAMLPYDMDAAQGYLSYGNQAEQYGQRRKDKAYSEGLAPFVAENDWGGAKKFAMQEGRGADDLLKLEEFASKADDRQKQAMADKLDRAASGLYAAAQFAEAGDMEGYNRSIEALAGEGFDVKDFQGQPYNAARLNAELVKSEKGLKILGVVNDARKIDIAERRADSAQQTADAAMLRASQGPQRDPDVRDSRLFAQGQQLSDDFRLQVKPYEDLADTGRLVKNYSKSFNAGKRDTQLESAIMMKVVGGLQTGVLSDRDIAAGSGGTLPTDVVRLSDYAFGRGRLSSQQVAGLMRVAEQLDAIAKERVQGYIENTRGVAKARGIPEEYIFGTDPEVRMFGPVEDPNAPPAMTYPTPDPRAVAALRNRPALAAEFDAKYGPGASSQYLTGRR